MIIYSILIFTNNKLLHEVYNLETFGYFYRSSVVEFIKFFSKIVIDKSIESCERLEITEKEYVFYVHNNIVVICDREYPSRVAFSLIENIINSEDTKIFIENAIIEYKNPEKVDSILKIKGKLDESILIIQKTIDSVLERGTKLDTLVKQSEDLSSSSKLFYEQAASRRCCSIS